jgi:Domain of unknown function (DUF5666)
MAGGTLAAALGLGVAAGAGATTTSGNTGVGAHGRTPGGPGRPTVAGKVTALSGDDITVETSGQASVTVVYSTATTFETDPGRNGGGTTASVSVLKVGDFIGVQGTTNGDKTVTATTVVIGRPPAPGRGRGGPGPRQGTGPSGAPTA